MESEQFCQNKDPFLTVPHEVILKIFCRLNERDISSVSLVNKNLYAHTNDDYLWHLMFMIRFGEEGLRELKEVEDVQPLKTEGVSSSVQHPTLSALRSGIFPDIENDSTCLLSGRDGENKNEGELEDSERDLAQEVKNSWLAAYQTLAKPITYIAKERRIVWFDHSFHWIAQADEESDYGTVVKLNHVWWFDVRAKIKSVIAGTYDIIWRLKIARHANLSDLNFEVNVILDRAEVISYVPDSHDYLDIALDGGWVEYCLPVQLVVPEDESVKNSTASCYGWHSVEARIINHNTQHVKTGLFIDYVRLRPHCGQLKESEHEG